MVGISIVTINAIESLGKLDITNFGPDSGVHHEAHRFTDSLAVVDVVITIQVEHVRCVREDSRDTDLKVRDQLRHQILLHRQECRSKYGGTTAATSVESDVPKRS